jgi:Fe-S oxidoreductase
MLAQENIATLDVAKEAGIKTIVTTCPHCFNTISTEYPVFGGNYEVMHHSQFLAKLVEEGKLTPEVLNPAGDAPGEPASPAALTKEAVAYHDPCYLGRYHDLYEEPRSILNAIPGVDLREINPCRGKAMCCGAGGAHAFMEETRGRRINHIRLEQALESEPDRIATACPYCLMMFEDATGAKGISDTLPVQDVAELLEGSLSARPTQEEASPQAP